MRRFNSKQLVWCALVAAPAMASGSYSAVIESHLGLASSIPESCALCHTNGQTGVGTVNTPFGKSAKAKGLVAGNDAKLKQVLDAMAADRTDSDGDGVSDTDELKARTNPNVAGTISPAETLKYGCGAQAAPGALGVGGLLAWLLLRRRR